MYKDQDKQREANKEQMRRARAKGNTSQGNTGQGNTKGMTKDYQYKGENEGLPPLERIPERTAQGNIRVSKPGDPDYEPQCETTRAFIEGRDKRPETGKRGKDIKTFEDLPPDVQVIINSMSMIDGKVDQKNKADRTEAAIHYAHMFPDRFYNTGVA